MNSQIKNIYDMLQGNINRMCVTDDIDELETMYDFLKYRTKLIYELNKKRIENAEKN